jgi:uncharacterized protein
MSAAVAATPPPVTLVTQTRVVAEGDPAFAAWQARMSAAVAAFAGFIEQKVIPPSPPAQVDWVILQRFDTMAAARSWMQSTHRAEMLKEAEPLLAGHDDIHVLVDGADGVLPSPASAVISTRVKPGQEAAYRTWERRIAAAQSKAAGFQGYRIEPPVPGVQESWVAIVRFDSDASLEAWMKSPERQTLLAEGERLSDEVRARIVRTGFDQWFSSGARPGDAAPPAWKQNMLVLLQLYPVVFLFGLLVQGPLLTGMLHMPFWLSLFIGNVASVLILSRLAPWTSARFQWWLRPAGAEVQRIDRRGAAIVLALYAMSLLVFSRMP